MDHLVYDLFSGMPASSEDGYSYCLVMVDVATRFVWLPPLHHKSAAEVAAALVDIVVDFGVPKVWSSDNGSEFAEVVSTMSSILGVDKRVSSPYYPESNGLAERSVQTALQVIRKTVEGEGADWARVLPTTQLAMNSKYHERIGCTPFEAMLGRSLNGFKDYRGTRLEAPTAEEIRTSMESVRLILR